MLFNFIGCPSSGKTTTAAMVFASLKDVGLIAEFLPEQARRYIAELRYHSYVTPKEKVVLTDEDQLIIMENQVNLDEVFHYACGPDVIIISDSSPLNALLYMNPELWEDPRVENLIKRSLAITDISFYSLPVPKPNEGSDPNRVHTHEQSLEIDKRIPGMIQTIAPDLNVLQICGTTSDRMRMVQEAIQISVSK